jgi:23S rRNA pseudouridine1911/1915/1917 synthase
MSEQDSRERFFTVETKDEGQRLDIFLAERCPEFSRSRIHADMKNDRVLVDGRPRPKGFRIKADSRIVFRPGTIRPMEAVAQDIPLLLHHCENLSVGGDPLRPGIVHRLDRDTSGLMAVALTDAAHRHLAEQLQDRRMGRTYLAVSWGRWKSDQDTLTGDIGRHTRFRQKMAVVNQGGKTAVSRYRVLEDFGFAQLCEVQLETGRTHQIRVHFAHSGHPVVGDQMYGDDLRARGIHNLDRRQADRMVKAAVRQQLHAVALRLVHPASGETLEFSANPPPDMAAVLGILRDDI